MAADSDGPQEISLLGLRFEKILVNVEQDLLSSLERARLESDHSLTIGEQIEAEFRDALKDYLPSGFGIGRGHVYDAYGDGSRQADVVITNPDHPLVFPVEKSGTYVVDGVAAAGEVKAVLDVAGLDDCITKGTAFKQLRMTITENDHVINAKQQTFMKQIGLVPPFFAVAFDSKIAETTLCSRLQNAGLVPPPPGKSLGEQDWAHTPQPPLDAVCILGKGICMYIRQPDNPMGIRIPEAPDRSGFAFLRTAAPLAWTLSWLHAMMPRIVRGKSVFSPYLIPPIRHFKYMAERGYIELADAEEPGQPPQLT